MELQQPSVVNFDPNSPMGQYVQAQNALQNFQLPLQHLQGQNQIQLPGQQLPLLQLGQGQFVLNQAQLLQHLGQGQSIQLPGQQAQTNQLPALHQGQHLSALQLQAQQGQALQLQGQNGQHVQIHGQNGQTIQLQGPNGQSIQLQGQNGQSIQLQGQNGQPIQIQGQNGQPIQIQGQNGQPIQIQGQNGQPIQIQGQNGQPIQIQGQSGQPIQIQGPNGQPIQIQGQNGQQIQLHSQNGQQMQLPGQNGQSLQLSNGQTIQLQGPVGQLMQLQNGQTVQIQAQQLAQLQGQQIQLQSPNQAYQLGKTLQVQGQQLQAVQLPGQMMSLQGQPCQVVHVQGPNGQIIQQVVPVMLGADQLGGLINPVQQQMLMQAQSPSPMVGQFVQTESGLVWQPTGVCGLSGDSSSTTAAAAAAAGQQFYQGTVVNPGQVTTEASQQPQEMAPSVPAETVVDPENNGDSQHSALVNGDSLCSVPGSTNTTTTTTSHPVARIQIAAEDPDDDTQPLYVNAKQYHRILKRRAARAKLESTGKVVRKRKKYLHESRHKHACQRTRGIGGRFFSIKVEHESEFGVKEEPESPHLTITEHSPGNEVQRRTPSMSQQQVDVDETPIVSMNGHV